MEPQLESGQKEMTTSERGGYVCGEINQPVGSLPAISVHETSDC